MTIVLTLPLIIALVLIAIVTVPYFRDAVEDFLLDVALYVATPLAHVFGLTPHPPAWVTPFRRAIRGTLIGVTTIMSLYAFGIIALIAGFLWKNSTVVGGVLIFFQLTALIAMSIRRRFGTTPNPRVDGYSMVIMAISIIVIMLQMSEKAVFSTWMGKTVIVLMMIGASVLAWATARGMQGHLGVDSLLGLMILIILVNGFIWIFPGYFNTMAAAARINENNASITAARIEADSLKIEGAITTKTPLFNKVELDNDGNIVGVPEVAKQQLTGDDWTLPKGTMFMTDPGLQKKAKGLGTMLIPIRLKDKYGKYLLWKDVFWVDFADTSLYAAATPEATPTPDNSKITTTTTAAAKSGRPRIVAGAPYNPGAGTIAVISSQTFTVPATTPLFSTGLDVTGRTVRIRYMSGRWSNSPGAGAIFTDGNGSGSWAGTVLTSAPFRALVGKTNNGYFMVGNSYEGQPGSGILYLTQNDTTAGGGYGDNQGSLVVTVEILR